VTSLVVGALVDELIVSYSVDQVKLFLEVIFDDDDQGEPQDEKHPIHPQ
jgi:hypothetical protein